MEQKDSMSADLQLQEAAPQKTVLLKKPLFLALCAALLVSVAGLGFFANSYLQTKQALEASTLSLEAIQAENEQLAEERTALQNEARDYNENIEMLMDMATQLEEKVTALNEEKEALYDQLSTLSGASGLPQAYHGEEGRAALLTAATTGNRVVALMAQLSQLDAQLADLGNSFTEAADQVDDALLRYNIPKGSPVNGGIYSCGYNPTGAADVEDGRVHKGIDLSTNSRLLPVRATAAGTVLIAEFHSGYGNYVVIDHQNGYTTLYAHCSELLVTAGQKVKAGDLIGVTGATGMASGIHCHYEVQLNGDYVNPDPFL